MDRKDEESNEIDASLDPVVPNAGDAVLSDADDEKTLNNGDSASKTASPTPTGR